MLEIQIIANIEERDVVVVVGGGQRIEMSDVIGLMEYLATIETGMTQWGTKDW